MSRAVVRVVGLPGTGKSWFRRVLAGVLGLPHTGIDDHRLALLRPGQAWPYGRDHLAWASLSAELEGSPGAIILENAGGRDLEILGDRPTFTIVCRADEATRRARLEERVATGYRFAQGRRHYVDQVLAGAELDLVGDEVVVDTTDPASVGTAIAAAQAWLQGSHAPTRPTLRVTWPATPLPHRPRTPARVAPEPPVGDLDWFA